MSAFAALAEPHRRQILDLLHTGERSVGDLVERLRISQPAVSKHLRALREAGLLHVRGDAQRRLYSVRPDPLHAIDDWLAPYRRMWAASLDDLEPQRHLDRIPTVTSPTQEAQMYGSLDQGDDRTATGLFFHDPTPARRLLANALRRDDAPAGAARDASLAKRLLVCRSDAKLQAELLPGKQRTQIMATTQARNGAPNVDAAYEQVKDFNEQWLTAARKAANFYIDSYEKIVDRTIDIELRAASLTQQEWLKSLIEAQADLTRELTNSYTSAARTLLK